MRKKLRVLIQWLDPLIACIALPAGALLREIRYFGIHELPRTKKCSVNSTYECRHCCIEPFEMKWLEQMPVEVVRKKVEDLDLNLFKELEENDILFIDSIHIIRPQGDVLFEFLEILPSLKKGVVVHIHDIFTPRDYPEEWVVNEVRFWNEQYLLEAFLTGNPEWKVLAAVNYLKHHAFNELKAVCPFLTEAREPGSFYIQKVA